MPTIDKSLEPKLTQSKEDLLCQLTDEEHKQRAIGLAEVWLNLQYMDETLADLKAEQKPARKAADDQILRLSHAVASREELRQVDCQTEQNLQTLRMTMTRLDTGEVVHDRNMTDKERQMVFGD